MPLYKGVSCVTAEEAEKYDWFYGVRVGSDIVHTYVGENDPGAEKFVYYPTNEGNIWVRLGLAPIQYGVVPVCE